MLAYLHCLPSCQPSCTPALHVYASAHRKAIVPNIQFHLAALWRVMNVFDVPDVDLMEQIYDSATVCLAPNDAESATITFDTGAAQGSITSPQLFNIFINALLRMLTDKWRTSQK